MGWHIPVGGKWKTNNDYYVMDLEGIRNCESVDKVRIQRTAVVIVDKEVVKYLKFQFPMKEACDRIRNNVSPPVLDEDLFIEKNNGQQEVAGSSTDVPLAADSNTRFKKVGVAKDGYPTFDTDPEAKDSAPTRPSCQERDK